MMNPTNFGSDATGARAVQEQLASGQLRFEQCARTASRVIDGKAIVITIDRNELHVLNEVGTRIWQLATGRSLAEIIDTVVNEFEVERARAQQDVCTFIEQLLTIGAAQITRSVG